MLHVARLGTGRAGYYLADLAPEVSAVRGPAAAEPGPSPEHPGRWTGLGSAGLGLTGAVDPARFVALLDQQAPNGRPLTDAVTSVAGYDLTFTCPKSVSVLFALGPQHVAEAVLDAHQSAVRDSVAYLEERAVTVRRSSGEDRHLLPTHGAVGAAFTHGTSRSLDPHLHTHVVVANVARGSDGRWSALDGRSLYAHAQAAGALHDSQLRHSLSRALAVEWTPSNGARGAGLVGMPEPLLATFSSRRAEIGEHLWRRGARSPTASRLAAIVTREAKVPALDPREVRGWWVARASSAGLGSAALAQVTGRANGARWSSGAGAAVPTVDEHRFAAALWVSPHATAARRDVVAAWAGAVHHGVPVRDVGGAVDAWVPTTGQRGLEEEHHALSTVIPSAAALRALGPRPATPELQHVWQSGAATIDAYRRRWDVTDRGSALGIDGSPSSLASLPARRLADHLEVTRSLEQVSRTLGRDDAVRSQDRGLGLG